MSTREFLRAERARIESRLAQLDRYPAEDPYEDGQVVTFTRLLPRGVGASSSRSYSYAAIRVGGRWYTTGGTCPRGGHTWDQFIDWLNGAGEGSALRELVPADSASAGANARANDGVGSAVDWLLIHTFGDARSAKKLYEDLQVIWSNLSADNEPSLARLLEYIQRADRDPIAKAELMQAISAYLLVVPQVGSDSEAEGSDGDR